MREENRSEGVRKGKIGRKIMRVLAFTFLGIIMAALFAFVFGVVVEWLWNRLMPEIFGLRQITYWQAFGLLLLARLLFGRFGHHAPSRHGDRFKKGSFHDHVERLSHHGRWGKCGRGRSNARPETSAKSPPEQPKIKDQRVSREQGAVCPGEYQPKGRRGTWLAGFL